MYDKMVRFLDLLHRNKFVLLNQELLIILIEFQQILLLLLRLYLLDFFRHLIQELIFQMLCQLQFHQYLCWFHLRLILSLNIWFYRLIFLLSLGRDLKLKIFIRKYVMSIGLGISESGLLFLNIFYRWSSHTHT